MYVYFVCTNCLKLQGNGMPVIAPVRRAVRGEDLSVNEDGFGCPDHHDIIEVRV